MKMEKESETISPEVRKSVELIIEIENLFHQLEGELDEEIKKSVKNKLRDKLKQYRRILGKQAEEEVREYYNRLEKLEKTA
jgi:hypothetical protein